MIKTISLVVPALVTIRGKNKYLNLNAYSNWHHIVRNNIKKKFSNIIYPQLSKLPKMAKIQTISYTLITTSKRKRDRMNVYSIVDKFFCDALQEQDIIKDDSDDFIENFIFTKTEYIKGKANQLRVKIKIEYYEN